MRLQFWLGFVTARAIGLWQEDRHGSLQGYIDYLYQNEDSWVQVPALGWVLLLVFTFVWSEQLIKNQARGVKS